MALLQTKGLSTGRWAIATAITSGNPLILGLLTSRTQFFCHRRIVNLSFVNILGIRGFAQKNGKYTQPIFQEFPQSMTVALDPRLVCAV
jgi:hypothetical protein